MAALFWIIQFYKVSRAAVAVEQPVARTTPLKFVRTKEPLEVCSSLNRASSIVWVTLIRPIGTPVGVRGRKENFIE
jgi:hypothetical protein